MKLKTIFHRAAAGALCLLLCLSGLTQPALAAAGTSIETTKDCTLTIRYDKDLTNVTFWVYRVAKLNAEGEFTMEANSGYRGYLSRLNSKGARDWWSTAKDLRSIASRTGEGFLGAYYGANGVPALDDDGQFCREIKLGKLVPGLYLVVTSDHTETEEINSDETKSWTVETAPALVSLPNMAQDKDGKYVWKYDLVSDMRSKSTTITNEKRFKNIQVTKSWTNYGYARPSSVTIELWRRDRSTNVSYLYDTITLSDRTGWSKIWTGLDSLKYDWDVVEINVPEGYTAHKTWVDDYNVAIANVHTPPPGTSNTPGVGTHTPGGGTPAPGGGTPPPGGTNPPRVTPRPTPDVPIDDPDVPLGDKTPSPDAAPRPSDDEIELDDPDVPLGDLPQTGQLWWPVPVLAIAGVFLMIVGLVRHRRGEYDEE